MLNTILKFLMISNGFFKAFAGLAILLVFASCQQNFQTADSGLQYRMVTENVTNAKPIEGEIVTMKFKYTDAEGNLIEQSDLFRTQLKKPSHDGGCIEDALYMMHKGDSGIFKINTEKYYTKSRKEYVPENLNPEENLIFYIKLVDITTISDFKSERQMAYISDARNEEKLMQDFLRKTNITVDPTASGLYIVELKKGTGKKPEPGKKVQVHYMGYFIDGQLFDSSYDRNQPFVFHYGVGEVIQGWDEGIAHMQVGGKYKLVIPSYLAYGDQQRGPIPPNTTLIFEIELLEAE